MMWEDERERATDEERKKWRDRKNGRAEASSGDIGKEFG